MADRTVTVRPSGGDYTSIPNAITGEIAYNSVLGADVRTISVEGDWTGTPHTSYFSVAGFDDSGGGHVEIVDNSNGTFSHEVSAQYTEAVRTVNRTKLVGLKIKNTHNQGSYGIFNSSGALTVDRCTISGYADVAGIRIRSGNVINCKLTSLTGIGVLMTGETYDTQSAIYRNTIGNCGSYGIQVVNTPTYLRNNVSAGNTGGDYSVSGATVTYDHCFSSDGTGTTTTINYDTTNFVSVTAGLEDFNLVSGSNLIDAGVSLSGDATYPVNYDITGTTITGTPDGGAYEYVSAVVTRTLSYDDNGSTGGTVPVDGNSPYDNGDPVTVLGNTGSLVRVGYSFAGWNTVADGSGTAYDPDDTFNITADTVLYAQWTFVPTRYADDSTFKIYENTTLAPYWLNSAIVARKPVPRPMFMRRP